MESENNTTKNKKIKTPHSGLYKAVLWTAVGLFSVSAIYIVIMVLLTDFDNRVQRDAFWKALGLNGLAVWYGLLSILFARFYEKNTYQVARGVAIGAITSCLAAFLVSAYVTFTEAPGDGWGRILAVLSVIIYSAIFAEIHLKVKSEVRAVVLARNVTTIVMAVAVAVLCVMILGGTTTNGDMIWRFALVAAILAVTGAIVTRIMGSIYKNVEATESKQMPAKAASAAGQKAGGAAGGHESAGEDKQADESNGRVNKTKFIAELVEKTGRSERDCIVINSVLESHFLVGRNAKQEIVEDFVRLLDMDEAAADELYNLCMGTIAAGVFKR